MNDSEINKRLDELDNKVNLLLLLPSHSQSPFQSAYSNNDEIGLRELWNVLWQSKWWIIGITSIFAVLSVVYALSLPNIYKSEALLAPSDENSGGGLAGMAGQLGGLATLAGVNLGGGANDKTALALEILKSRGFISQFIQKYDLLVPLMAAKGWNREKDELIIDEKIYDVAQERWVRQVPTPYQSKPSLLEAHKRFSELLKVSQSKETGFVTLGFEFYSPKITQQWVGWLVRDINSAIKERDVGEAQRGIQYLTSQLEKVAIADMRAIFYELIEKQTKIIMFAEVRNEYVFKTIDEAVVAENKSQPKRALILMLGIVLGGLCSLPLFLIKHVLFNKK